MDEVMNVENVEVVDLEPIEEVVQTGNSGKGLLAVVAVGAALGVGTLLYKKVIKPIIAKRKAAKELEVELDDGSYFDTTEDSDSYVENEN